MSQDIKRKKERKLRFYPSLIEKSKKCDQYGVNLGQTGDMWRNTEEFTTRARVDFGK